MARCNSPLIWVSALSAASWVLARAVPMLARSLLMLSGTNITNSKTANTANATIISTRVKAPRAWLRGVRLGLRVRAAEFGCVRWGTANGALALGLF